MTETADAEPRISVPDGSAPGGGSTARRLLASLVLMGGLALAAWLMGQVPLYGVMLMVLALAVPAAAVHIYFAIIHRTRLALTFRADGLLARLLGWRFLVSLSILALSLVFSFFLLLQLSGLKPFDWAFLALMAPVFLGIHRAALALMRRESSPWLAEARAAAWAAWAAPLVMLPIYAFGLEYLGSVPLYETLDAARAAHDSPLLESGSALLRESAAWSALLLGYRDFFLGHAGGFFSQALALAGCVLGFGAVFLNISSLLACVYLPAREYRRLFLPLTPDSDLPKVPPLTAGLLAAGTAAFMMLVYLPGFGWLEQRAMEGGADVSVKIRRIVQDHGDQAALAVIVEGRKYNAALLAEREQLKRAAALSSHEAREALVSEYNRVFDGFEKNVDRYLDWYYSLSGEYKRLLHLAMGQLETYMQDKFTEVVGEGVDSGGPGRIMARYQDSLDEYARRAEELLAEYELSGDAPVEVLETMTRDEFLTPFKPPSELLSPGTRAGASLVGGVGAGVAVGVVASKVATKGIFKIAAQALTKVAAATGVSVLGGTAAGAAIGSVIPGPGTAVGAGVGLAVGVIGSLLFDQALLKLEEALGREQFKMEVLESINELRREALSSLH